MPFVSKLISKSMFKKKSMFAAFMPKPDSNGRGFGGERAIFENISIKYKIDLMANIDSFSILIITHSIDTSDRCYYRCLPRDRYLPSDRYLKRSMFS